MIAYLPTGTGRRSSIPPVASSMTGRGLIEVTFIDGRPVLLLTPDDGQLEELAALVDRANAQRVYRGGLPIPAASPFVGAARHVVALARLVPRTEPKIASGAVSSEALIDTKSSGALLGIGERAVRKRIAAGTLPARRFGTTYWIDRKDLVA